MLFGNNRDDLRKIYFTVWQKHCDQLPLEPQEQRILDVIIQHPEYHFIFKNSEATLEKEFFAELGDTNPFLHMGLHLAVLDQVSINQPIGITALYKKAMEVFADTHETDHCLANCLAMELFEMQKNQNKFNETNYLNAIKKAIKKGAW